MHCRIRCRQATKSSPSGRLPTGSQKSSSQFSSYTIDSELDNLTYRYGQFSHLWVDMMERLGLDVHCVDVPWGEGVHEDKLAEILRADKEKKIKAIAVVHNETTTGQGPERASTIGI